LIMAEPGGLHRLHYPLDGRGNRGAAARHSEATDDAGAGLSRRAAAGG
jgi:hypothetical protein